ncbi:MAG: hypothetical protein MHMPM18_002734, partial [Marteilia pararefringens]
MRNIITFFHHSALLSQRLEKYCKEANQTATKLKTITDIRWNSLYLAIKRFLALKAHISKSIIDENEIRPAVIIFSSWSLTIIQGKKIDFLTENEISLLENLSTALEIVYLASQKLGRNMVDLGTADKILDFTLRKLESMPNNVFSAVISSEIKSRIQERRNPELYFLCGILNCKIKFDESSEYFENPGFVNLVKFAEKLYFRLFKEIDAGSNEPDFSVCDQQSDVSLEQQMEVFISKKVKY